MKNMLLNRNVWIATVLTFGLGAVGVIKAYSPDDINPQPLPPRYGLIGVTPASQFLRVTVTNSAASATGAGACQVQLSYGNGEGQTLKQGALTTLAAGKSLTLDITAADLVSANGVTAVTPRYELLPAVKTEGSCDLVSSTQIVATETGQTSVYATVASGGINHNETLVRDTDSDAGPNE